MTNKVFISGVCFFFILLKCVNANAQQLLIHQKLATDTVESETGIAKINVLFK